MLPQSHIIKGCKLLNEECGGLALSLPHEINITIFQLQLPDHVHILFRTQSKCLWKQLHLK